MFSVSWQDLMVKNGTVVSEAQCLVACISKTAGAAERVTQGVRDKWVYQGSNGTNWEWHRDIETNYESYGAESPLVLSNVINLNIKFYATLKWF
jgi:hypothetical protein